MADLIVVCGPQAVGKMTVAESLRDKLKYNMMMNHDSIELSDRIFGFGTPAQRAFNEAIRKSAFDLTVQHGVDLIFTYVCAFEMQEERDYLTGLHDLFTEHGGRFYFVELSASLDARLQRNETPHRMEREVWFQHHLKIDNTDLTPDEVADRIIEAFGLVPNEKEAWEYRYGV